MFSNSVVGLALLLRVAPSVATPASNISPRDIVGTATISLAMPSNTPSHLASGFIYGLPDSADGSANFSIPDPLVKGMGFNYNRAGGAQITSLGWIAGEFEGRFLSALSNYRTTRTYGGPFQLLVHDLWGADGLQGSDAVWPGDDGDWTNFDAFLDTLISEIIANDMMEGLEIDIWNEPDGTNFWGTSQNQYLEMWKHSYQRFRAELPDVLLVGPSTAFSPTAESDWWHNFAAFISQEDCVPDIYSYHLLDPNANLRVTFDVLNGFRQTYGLPERPLVINEYGSLDGEQTPAGAAWYIGQFERYNVAGLRANWAGGYELHDFLANLLGKGNKGYFPVGEWQVYNYYTMNMTGQRVATSSSADDVFEVFATHEDRADSVKILAAVRPVAGIQSYDITVTGLSTLGIQDSVKVQTHRYDDAGWRTEVDAPVDLGIVEHSVVNDQITFWVTPETSSTAYTFQFV
ncbi:hypothetical protein PFICI_04600 [Pestalotiopsis fici W106-1]|uniref:Glycoside hydrolase family 39 protein n=1 Tax=Pestalotiopsis fici (strain W106-1 / CGMCC3.15140) TaxID=1229662 RepID=W3X9N5_PESFW|nr:uncharacterized protein PFICI_04600 [Pestalotiopsis fici W106-1]ETS82724.1 hypothetical protein PFICI_04600 [Pestalotiopsis fici W106-1]